MRESIAQIIHRHGQELLKEVQKPGACLADHLNLLLNQLLTWPFIARPARIIDSEDRNIDFETVIYSCSENNVEKKATAATISVNKTACAIYVAKNLCPKALQKGYSCIASFKSLNRTPIPKEVKLVNNTPIGIVFSDSSTSSIEEIAESMILLINNTFIKNHDHIWPFRRRIVFIK